MKISTEDIATLDAMLDILLVEQTMIPQDIQNEEHFSGQNWDFIVTEFNRLMYYFEYFGCAWCKTPGPRELTSEIRVNSRTANFKASGGFDVAFKSLLEQQQHQAVIEEKERNEGRLAKWQVKTFWWFFIFGLIGLVYGIYDGLFKTQKIDAAIEEVRKAQKESFKQIEILKRNKESNSTSGNNVSSDTIQASK